MNKLTMQDVLPGASPEFLAAWLRLDELCTAHAVAQAHQNVVWAHLNKEAQPGCTIDWAAYYMERCQALQEAVSERDLMIVHVKRLLVTQDWQTRHTLGSDLSQLLVEAEAIIDSPL